MSLPKPIYPKNMYLPTIGGYVANACISLTSQKMQSCSLNRVHLADVKLCTARAKNIQSHVDKYQQ